MSTQYRHLCPQCAAPYESGSPRGGVPASHPECRRFVTNARQRAYLAKRRAEGTEWKQQRPDRARESRRAARERLVSRSSEEIAADRSRLRPDGLKRCQECKEHLPLATFGDRAMEPDGLRHTCKPCDAERTDSARLRRIAFPSWVERELWACIYCDRPWEHVDHVIPQALGGTDEPHNLVPACAECNLSKQDTPVLAWIVSRR